MMHLSLEQYEIIKDTLGGVRFEFSGSSIRVIAHSKNNRTIAILKQLFTEISVEDGTLIWESDPDEMICISIYESNLIKCDSCSYFVGTPILIVPLYQLRSTISKYHKLVSDMIDDSEYSNPDTNCKWFVMVDGEALMPLCNNVSIM